MRVMEHDDCCGYAGMNADEAHAMDDQMIAQYGHMVRGFPLDGLICSYSIGLWEQGLPEIVLSGFPMDMATGFINITSLVMKEFGIPALNSINTDIAALPIKFGAVSFDFVTKNMGGALNRIERIGGTIPQMPITFPSPALQFIWTDREGRFPGDSDFDTTYLTKQNIFADVVH